MEDVITDELDFYSKLSKNLIFNLPNYKDRALAAAWVKKVREESSGTVKLRTDYMKLLLMALQRSHLVGIFADDPGKYEKLDEFPDDFDITDMARNLIEKEHIERQERIGGQVQGLSSMSPPYITDCSSDLREYVAMQDLPGFGVHCYYAISKEPIKQWKQAEKGLFSKEAKSTAELPPSIKEADPFSCICPPAEGGEPSECTKRIKPTVEKKIPKRKWGIAPPTTLLGISPPPDDRTPPAWGSNLLEIKEKPKVDSDEDISDDDVLDDIFSLAQSLNNVSQFLGEYNSGQIVKELQKVSKTQQAQNKKGGAVHGSIFEDESEESGDEQTETSLRYAEIANDSYLLEHIKMQISQTVSKQQVLQKTQDVQSSAPSRAFLPITTPKSPPIPKRPKASERLFEELSAKKKDSAPTKGGYSTPKPLSPSAEKTEKGGKTKDTSIAEVNKPSGISIDEELNMWIKRLGELEKECEKRIQACICKPKS